MVKWIKILFYIAFALSVCANVLFLAPYVIRRIQTDRTELFTADASDEEVMKAVVKASLNFSRNQMVMSEFRGLSHDVKALFRSERNSGLTNNFPSAYNLVGLSEYALKYNDADVLSKVRKKADSWIGKDGCLTYEISRPDQCPIGILYLNLYNLTKDEKYKKMADGLFDFLKSSREKDNIIPYYSPKTYYVDALGMYVPFLMEYFKATNDSLAYQIAVDNISEYQLNGLDDETGLPYHGYNVETGIKVGSANWGRGIGWYLLALTYCPEKNDLLLAENIEKMPYTQFPLSSDDFDSSTALMFELYKKRMDSDYKLNLDFIKPYVRQSGVVTQCSGDTYHFNDYSNAFGNSELCNGLLLMLYSKDFCDEKKR